MSQHETEIEETEKFDNGKVLKQAADDVTSLFGLPLGFVNLSMYKKILLFVFEK